MVSLEESRRIVQLKVRLLGLSPMIWRRVLLPESVSLRELQESTENCGAHLMLQVRTRTLDGTLRGSSNSGVRLKAEARSVETEPCAA